MSNLTKLQASVDKLATDLTSEFADIRAKLDALVLPDPAEQAKVDAIVAQLDALDTTVQDFLPPGAPAPEPPPAPPA